MAAWFVKAKTGPTGWWPRARASGGSLAGLARASFNKEMMMFFNCRTTAALARRHARLAAIPDADAAVAMSLISPYYYLVD